MRRRPPWAWRLLVGAVLWLLRRVRGWRIHAQRPHVLPPPDRPYLAVFNHTSAIDGFVVAEVLWRGTRHWVQPLVKAEVFEVPVLGWLARAAGAIPVHRGEGEGREHAYRDAIAQLKAGGTVLLAPESTITHDGNLLPLRHGAARLAQEAGVDVLVVTHFGAQRGFSPVVRFPERGAVVTVALDVISPEPDEDATSVTGRIAATMLDRSLELQAAYPDRSLDARWWPPYSAPASPTATARENLERYQESMAQAIAAARERMTQLASDHEVDRRLAEARERAQQAAADLAEARERAQQAAAELTARARERTEHLAAETRERAEHLAAETRERVGELSEQARDKAAELQDRLPGRGAGGPESS
ncbi:MAG: 1-acyl-sn-glycerol-3-phosphate acyltransferase [Nitriliruptoraceae bacterium]